MSAVRPDPDALLARVQREEAKAKRGKLKVFFGATVDYAGDDGEVHTVTIVGVDEVNLGVGHVSWISPIARALLKAKVGDTVTLHTPAGVQQIDILDVHYPPKV